MHENIKARWTTALRSGQYVQGQGQLRDEIDERLQHCCLGVLCDLYAQDQDPNFWANPHLDLITDFLPDPVWRWAGLPSQTVKVTVAGKNERVSWLNDNLNYNFNSLADLIDHNLVIPQP